ncbi:MAG: hypothetical protein Q9195_004550 [Heterodermia aff. obscurata]
MSGLELLAVVACVAAVCSAYHDGAEILQQIKAKRKARRAARQDLLTESSTQELELSLHRGEDVVQSQYDRDYKRFGAAFANGDDIAKDALKDIIIHLQGQVIANLKIQWQQDTYVDFSALQDVSDSSQDKAILVLMQLQQRIITSGPIENLRPPPLFASPRSLEEKPPIPQARQISGRHEPYNAHHNSYPPIDSPTQANTYPPFSPYEDHDGYPQPSSPTQLSSCSPQLLSSGQYDGQLSGHHQQAMIYQTVHQPPQSPPIQFNGHSQQQRLLIGDNSHHRRSPSSQAPPVIGQYRSAPEGFITEVFNNVSPSPSDGSWTSHPAYHEGTPPGFVKPTFSDSKGKNEKTEKSHFSSVTKLNLFGKKNRAACVNPATSTPSQIQRVQGSAVPNYLLPIVPPEQPCDPAPSRKPSGPPPTPSSYSGSRFSSISTSTATTQSSYEPPETPDFNPWADRGVTTDSSSTISRNISKGSSPTQTLRSSGSIRRAPAGSMSIFNNLNTVNSKDVLPSETNKYAGFCKGAWKAQIGDRKKAMDERQRPGGMYNAARYWQCSKCKFEGRLVMLDKKTKAVDKRVLTAEGVQFRWDFLFKSHVETKEATSDFLKSTFGCIFCTAEGKGTPTFGGAQMLMAHLQEHRDRLPTGEVLYRMNCLVGPKAPLEDDFDINLIGKEGVDF